MSIENKVKFCTNCGGELKPGAKFCTNCGAKVEYPAVNEEAAAAAPVEETSIPAEEPAVEAEPAAAQDAPAEEPVAEEPAAEEPAAEETAEPEQKQNSGFKEAAFGAGAAAAGAAGGFSGNGAYNSGAEYAGGYGNAGNSSYNSYSAPKKEKYNPSIIECFVLFFKNYVNFKGRIGRREYWLTVLSLAIVQAVLSIIGQAISAVAGSEMIETVLTGLFSLAVIIPGISMAFRRLHDRNKSGAFYLFNLIPLVGSIILIVWYIMAGTPDENRFGDIERYEELAAKHEAEGGKKKSKSVIFIVIGIIAIIVISVVVIGVAGPKDTVSDDYSSSTTTTADSSYDTDGGDDFDIDEDIDDDIDTTPAPAGDFDVNSESSYIGKWKAVKAEYDGIALEITDDFMGEITMIFRNDGTMTLSSDDEDTDGYWSIVDGHVELKGAEDSPVYYKDGMLQFESEGVTFKFTKVN